MKICKEFMDNITNKPWPVILYGAGLSGIRIASILHKNGIDVKYFSDSNKVKIGKTVEGIPVISLSELDRNIEYHIIVTPEDLIIKYEIMNYIQKLDLRGNLYLEFDKDNTSSFFYYDSKTGKTLCKDSDFHLTMPWFYQFAYTKCPTIDYIRSVYPQLHYIIHDTYFCYMNLESKYFNIKNGYRYTTDTPGSFDNTIHFFGNSRFFGMGVEDSETIPSCLQRITNKKGKEKYRVLNFSVGASTSINLLNQLMASPLKAGDVVVFSNCQQVIDKIYYDTDDVISNINGTKLYLEILKTAFDYCKAHSVQFVLAWLGVVSDIKNKSLEEQYMNDVLTYYPNNNFIFPAIEKDKVLNYCAKQKIDFIDLVPAIQRPHDYGIIFIDWSHYGPNGSELLANKIYDYIFESPETTSSCQQTRIFKVVTESTLNYVMPIRNDPNLVEYRDYLRQIKNQHNENSGIIVMNANPFTKGHRYLIEYALKQVDFLYVMVLEEEQSLFRFRDRLAMVQQGTAGLDNVTVLRSGEFVISAETFPEYFNHAADTADCSRDLILFGNFIAKELNATKRFVGTEPFSKVTDSYNEQMKRILPQFGIEVIEVPRYSENDIIISATAVRDLFKEKRMDEIKELVPETTYAYLAQNNPAIYPV